MSCSTDWAKLAYFNILQAVLWTRRESNSHRQNRNLKFYPLNYESLLKKRHKDKIKLSLLQRWATEKRWMCFFACVNEKYYCELLFMCHLPYNKNNIIATFLYQNVIEEKYFYSKWQKPRLIISFINKYVLYLFRF